MVRFDCKSMSTRVTGCGHHLFTNEIPPQDLLSQGLREAILIRLPAIFKGFDLILGITIINGRCIGSVTETHILLMLINTGNLPFERNNILTEQTVIVSCQTEGGTAL